MRGWTAVLSVLWLCCCCRNAAARREDKIVNLPGLVFDTNYDQYAGYLLGTNQAPNQQYNDTHIFYWLTESQNSTCKDPVVFWFNGGPGCSSLGGLFTENGPFHANPDGQTLFENVFAWNKMSNLVFIESPPSVGFSYTDSGRDTWSDDETAAINAAAIDDFFRAFPTYSDRDFYITGESYGGVYIPTMSRDIVQRISNGTFSNKYFKGFAIGNAYVDQVAQINTVIEYYYYHALLSKSQWDNLQSLCCNADSAAEVCPDNCNYAAHLVNKGIYTGWVSDGTPCGDAVYNTVGPAMYSSLPDNYNIDQSCYSDTNAMRAKHARIWMPLSPDADPWQQKELPGAYAQGNDTLMYLNRRDVQAALHIPDHWGDNHTWVDCNMIVNAHFTNTYITLAGVFEFLLNQTTVPDLRMMLYNGDLDTVCNMFGDYQFIYNLAHKYNMPNRYKRGAWYYRGTPAGMAESWVPNLEHLTVNGAGHFVPMDRAGPALQMITNFVRDTNNYTIETGLSSTLAPLKPTPTPPPNPDLIVDLPGPMFKPPFAQYSGYLDAGGPDDDKYHNFYWYTESYNNPTQSPVVFWFNGGPGCSSIDGLMNENGPFHPNNDGKTLYENVYAWNKVANVVFMESPPGVGFSYTDQFRITWSDDEVAALNAAAINDFFRKYPALASHGYFITGESYGGIYLPTLARDLINGIAANTTVNTNFMGMAIGNGCTDWQLNLNSMVEYMYYHGLVSYEQWTELTAECCTNKGQCPDQCDYYAALQAEGSGYLVSDTTKCGNLTAYIAYVVRAAMGLDNYNIYQNCYEAAGQRLAKHARHSIVGRMKPAAATGERDVHDDDSGDIARKINYDSTDHTAGLPCFGTPSEINYFNTPEIQEALHVADAWKNANLTWSDCNNLNYSTTYDTMKPIFDFLVTQTIKPLFRILIYNGDADTVCNFLGDRRLVANVSADNNLKDTTEAQWQYRGQMAGYWVQYSALADRLQTWYTKIDLITVNGAGHFVPQSRAGPALQMLSNWLHNTGNYSQPYLVDVTPQPIIT